MKPNEKDVAAWITKAGKTERTAEFEYPYLDGFYVQIAYASRFQLNQIRQLAAEPYTDRRTRDEKERYNEEKLNLGYAERIVKGWRGLTVGALDGLIPGSFDQAKAQIEEEIKKKAETKMMSDDEIRDAEVVYCIETAVAILSNSVDFVNWIVDVAGDAKRYSSIAAKKKEEYENLK